MLTTELINLREQYYSNKDNKNRLLLAMNKREVSFIDYDNPAWVMRGFSLRNETYLDTIFKYYNMLNNRTDMDTRNYNIYLSLAKYDFIPAFTLNLKERSAQTSKWFRESAHLHLMSYDMLLDFDRHKTTSSEKLQNEVYKMSCILDLYQIKYLMYPSGSGFQIIIDSCNFPKIDFNKIKRQTELIKKRFNISSLCLVGIGHMTKIRKCEYSIVNNKLVTPLNNLQLSKFSYSDVFIDNSPMIDYNTYYNNDSKDIDYITNWRIFETENFLLEGD